MPTEAFASPLIVWLGSKRYAFPPGKDVIVGHDRRADIRIDRPDEFTPPTAVVLHYDGRQWVAIDRSRHGIYVDGARMSTVFIHDGQAITIGHPQYGPRLVFQVGAPMHPPPRPRPGPRMPPPPPRPVPPRGMPAQPQPIPPPSRFPTRRFQAPRPQPEPPRRAAPEPPSKLPTLRMRWAQSQPGPAEAPPRPAPPHEPPRPPLEPPPPPPQPAPQSWAPPVHPAPETHPTPPLPPVDQRKRPSLAARLTGAVQNALHKLPPRRRKPRPDTATAAPSPRPAPKTGALQAHQLRLTSNGQQVLADVSFTAEPGTLTAVIGPSVASNTALIDLLGGAVRPSVGTVTFEGHDVQAEHMRSSIGMVPRYDLMHPQLTIEQALGYAAELRLPPGTSADHRRQIVHWALNELKLNSLRTIQVRNLSAEQRKRASIAMELLTGPSLLVLDEPSEGMDPALQRETTAMLRRFADEGRVVVVSTTQLTDLDMCDQVLLLTATGTPAFAGAPDQVGAALGTTDWQEIFAKVSTDPNGAHTAFLARQQEASSAAEPEEEPAQTAVEPAAAAPQLRLRRKIAIAARRQAWLILGDQRYFIFLTILPALFGALSLVVPGHAGLGPADSFGNSPDEAVEILGVLNIGAVVMGTALTIRDLSGEKRIFRREQANGLSASAYLAAKIIVYSVVAIVQTAIITTVAVAGKGAPTQGAVLLGSAAFELFLTLAVTAIVAAIVTMALSSLAEYAQQLLLIAVLTTLISLMFAGALFPVAGRFGLEQISWLVPARWGFAASASTVDVPAVNLLASSDETWTHSAGWWALDMAILTGFGVVATAFLRWRLRADHSLRRE